MHYCLNITNRPIGPTLYTYFIVSDYWPIMAIFMIYSIRKPKLGGSMRSFKLVDCSFNQFTWRVRGEPTLRGSAKTGRVHEKLDGCSLNQFTGRVRAKTGRVSQELGGFKLNGCSLNHFILRVRACVQFSIQFNSFVSHSPDSTV